MVFHDTLLSSLEEFDWSKNFVNKLQFSFNDQNGKQLYDVMVERAGPSKTSGPKES